MGTTNTNVNELRAFNRFHTNIIGALQAHLVKTPFTLTEARVLFELAQSPTTEVRALRGRLHIDAGYLSRIVTRFEADRLVSRRRPPADGGRQVIELTARGRRAFATVDQRASRAAAELLARLS